MKKNIKLSDLLINKPLMAYEKFHLQTNFLKSKKKRLSLETKTQEKTHYKSYSRFKEIKLPQPKLSSKIGYKNVLISRKSIRKFNNHSMDVSSLSSLLFYTAGLKNSMALQKTTRFYPSAGARYPLETYLISLNINNLSKGVYHYYLPNHSLERLSAFKTFCLSDYVNPLWAKNAAAIIIISCAFNRTITKYGNRGYRYILIEVGHLGQNIYLTANALNIGCCALCDFNNKKLNFLLNIDERKESVVYIFAVGKTI